MKGSLHYDMDKDTWHKYLEACNGGFDLNIIDPIMKPML